MANRIWNRFQALEKEIKTIHAAVDVGASGAPTITKALGTASVTRTGAGTYDVVLSDKYTRLMSYDIKQVGASQDLTFQVTAQDAAAGTFTFVSKAANTATDPTSGTSLLIKLEYKNSSVGE